MDFKVTNLASSRRQFLFNVLPAGTMLCLGCSNLFSSPISEENQDVSTEKHKFLEDSGMNVEEVFQYAYRDNFIPFMQAIAKDIGEEKFIAMLKKTASANAAQMMRGMTKDLPKKDFSVFNDFFKNIGNAFPYKNALVSEIVEETDKVIEVRYKECLFAKTFLEANAADIGYATQCHPSDAMVRAFNPKIRVENPKNFMKGDEVCIERFVWEG